MSIIEQKQLSVERHFRLHECSSLTGYSVATFRKKIARREIGYRKVGRILLIPESELQRLLGEYRPPIGLNGP